MTAIAVPPAAAGSLTPRLVGVAQFASLVYVFAVVFLVVAAVIPAAVAGWQPLAVVSGSMQPAVAPGSLVMVQPAEDDRYYAAPTILAFADPSRPGRLLTHRVVDTASQDGTVVYTTKGDANRVADSGLVAHDDVVGAVRMVIPYVGLPQTWVHDGDPGRVALLALVSFTAIGALLVRTRP